MLKKLYSLITSFSFRTGLLIFVAFFVVQAGVRVASYNHSRRAEYQDIKRVIQAHSVEIDHEIRQQPIRSFDIFIQKRLADFYDKNLLLAVYENGKIYGNIEEWPENAGNAPWIEITISRTDAPPQHILGHITNYSNDIKLLVGYDLEVIDTLDDFMISSVVNNVIISFIGSLLISLVIIWLINKNIRQVNAGFTRVMGGNLDYRIQTQGGKGQFESMAMHFNAMMDWLQALVNTVKYSTTAIAHDMRTPLSRHRLTLQELLEHESIDQAIQQKLRASVLDVDKLSEMFENILSIARAEGRSEVEHFSACDINEILQDVLEFYEPLLHQKHISLSTDFTEAPLMLQGDRQLITQAIANLVDNAAKYTPNQGNIHVNTEYIDTCIHLTIADNGPGIPEEYLLKVKERFFRLDSSRNTAGSGLGLSLVEAVATLHRGHLKLSNNKPGLKVELIF